MLASLCACALAQQFGPAQKALPELPRNVSLVMPMSKTNWMAAIAKVGRRLSGGKVAAAVFFAADDDANTIGPMTGTLAKMLGGERPVFIGAVLDADATTIGDSSVSLPHVLLIMPPRITSGEPVGQLGVSKERSIHAWDDWTPNAFSVEDRKATARRLFDFVDTHLGVLFHAS